MIKSGYVVIYFKTVCLENGSISLVGVSMPEVVLCGKIDQNNISCRLCNDQGTIPIPFTELL